MEMEAIIGGVKMKWFLKASIMKSEQENCDNLKFHIGYVKRFATKKRLWLWKLGWWTLCGDNAGHNKELIHKVNWFVIGLVSLQHGCWLGALVQMWNSWEPYIL